MGVPKVKLAPKCLSSDDSTFVFIILWDKYLEYLVKVNLCYLVEITHQVIIGSLRGDPTDQALRRNGINGLRSGKDMIWKPYN